jgi:ABC-2 type transport system permease protein
MWALYAREVKRFQKIWLDTLMSPIVSMILYLAIFGIVAGDRVIGNIPYVTFVYSGLLAMMLVNSSFSNPSFALIISKNVGTIADLQVVPIPAWRIGVAYALAALTRAIITVAFALLLTVWFIPGLTVQHPLILLVAALLTGIEFGMLGVAFGMWAKNFEAMTFLTTFIMQPMIFLAGVFYPISQLPGKWAVISSWNPLHHNINLLRYGMTGYQDATVVVSFSVVVVASIFLFYLMQYLAKKKLIMV